MTDKRLIEVDFPLEQVSLDSVHEKNVRHGHISTLHIWPARRPLAACRAALIATLLPDPGNAEERKAIYRRMAGTVVETIKPEKKNGKTVEKRKRETQGGILHWKRENGPDLDWFRDKIREAYGGRAPKVLDPFAGGGAIPLEAMRLGCEVTANDLNPVAWFILKCTLEYPQKLAGQTRPLPDFALQDRDFMASFLKAKGYKGTVLRRELAKLNLDEDDPDKDGRVAEPELLYHRPLLDADLAWQVRAWGRWVLAQARKRLARRYPTYAEFQALKPEGNDSSRERVLQRGTHPGLRPPLRGGEQTIPSSEGWPEGPGRVPPLQLLEPDADGKTDVGPLNAGYTRAYLADPRNPRWIAKPTVAYLWARTVRCKGCRATLPLLKTKWLAKKDNKRVLLTVTPERDIPPSLPPLPRGARGDASTSSRLVGSIRFGIETDVPQVGGNAAQRREHDKRCGAGTMSRSGAQCPCCPTIMSMDDIRYEGRAGRLGAVMTAVVVDGLKGKEYRLPTEEELRAAEVSKEELDELYGQIPFGLPEEPTPRQGPGAARAFSVDNYGFDQWAKLFTARQLLCLGSFVNIVRSLAVQYGTSRDIAGYRGKSKNAEIWREAVIAYSAICLDRLADYSSAICSWHNSGEKLRNTFGRFALPIVWDYTEVNPLSDTSGNFLGALEWVARFISHTLESTNGSPESAVYAASATQITGEYATIITDPPYYDAIPYSDLMDFFHVWVRRSLHGLCPEIDTAFHESLGPKWNHDTGDGELIDDASRFDGDKALSKKNYEDGMARAFQACHAALQSDGRLVVVFANKSPDAWETLAAALIRAGFVVDGSWPIQTEMGNRTRAMASAALSSSVWLVCKKRSPARPGWDTTVLAEMRERIRTQLRDFWDAGIRGPDFVWAATGPALEAFSKYPVVKKADEAGAQMSVSEFLREVRRIVVDFVVGRVLTQDGEAEAVSGLDDVTTYYLLHRKDFGLDKAPVGACILYALSCNLSDRELTDRLDILSRAGKTLFDDLEDDDRTDEVEESEADSGGTGNTIKLKAWHQRRAKWLGFESPRDRPVPLIDQAHRLMHLWRAGDEVKVNDYLDTRGLKRNALFVQLLQALIELAPAGSEERAILESLSNHIAAHGGIVPARQAALQLGGVGGSE